jgi:hypothetical protein
MQLHMYTRRTQRAHELRFHRIGREILLKLGKP